jgi:hypothetical protein
MNDDLKGIWKEAVVALSWHLPKETEEIPENS